MEIEKPVSACGSTLLSSISSTLSREREAKKEEEEHEEEEEEAESMRVQGKEKREV